MPWDNPLETIIGSTGEVYTAPVNTARPTGFGEPGGAWAGTGYASEDGVAFSYDRTIEDYRAWQSASPIRRSKTEESFSVSVALLQWNETTVPLALGGGAIASVSGGFEYTPAGPEETLEERALFVVVHDGDRSTSIYIPRGNASEAVEGSFARGALSELPFTFQALQPTTGSLYKFDFSDATAFATGS